MLRLREKLEVQDLVRQLEDNNFNYDTTINKTLMEGEIVYLEIKIEGRKI